MSKKAKKKKQKKDYDAGGFEGSKKHKKNKKKNKGKGKKKSGKSHSSKKGSKKHHGKKTGGKKGDHPGKNQGKQKKRSNLRREELIAGTMHKHKKGFGFVTPDDETLLNGEDVFIARENIGSAMNGDKVLIDLVPVRYWRNSPEGMVYAIEERAFTKVMGVLDKGKGFGFVVPADRSIKEDIYIEKKNLGNARDGDYVSADIIKYPERGDRAEGKITKIIAGREDPRGDILALLMQNEVRDTFPSRAEAEAAYIAKKGISDSDFAGRRDLRDWTVVTIDGADSKDFDDGVSCKKLPNGNYSLGVHIADVSHYVHKGDALDEEALRRGNSIYILDKVIPMLPFELSNELCSLNPHKDRLTLTCLMEIDLKGNVVSYDIFESVINSTERLVYDDVSDIFEADDEELKARYSHILEDLTNMKELAEILRKSKEDRGSIDFDITEANICIDEDGVPVDIRLAERRMANRMIEEFMLKANEVVAYEFAQKKVPFLYRVHKRPEFERMEEFATFIDSFGLTMKGGIREIRPKQLAELLERIEGEEYSKVVSSVMLRTMQKAYYDTKCLGHFGLSLEYYTHFTSPIRRYADLFIHRAIKALIHGDKELIAAMGREATYVANSVSERERETVELERDVEKLKKCQYIASHIGEVFTGVISGVTSYGFYVEIPNTVEGMVSLDSLRDDYYEYEEGMYRLAGEHTGRIYSLGDKVTIKVDYVDIENREIDFRLA